MLQERQPWENIVTRPAPTTKPRIEPPADRLPFAPVNYHRFLVAVERHARPHSHNKSVR